MLSNQPWHGELAAREIETLMALEQSEAQLRRLFENMSGGLILSEVIVDEGGRPFDHRRILVNQQAELLLGIPREAILGKTQSEAPAGVPVEILSKCYEIALSDGVFEYERFNTALGRYFECKVFCPKRGQFAMHFHDITKRKQMEAEVVRLNCLHASLSEINRMLLSPPAGDQLFAEVCRIIVEKCDFLLVWIGDVDPTTGIVSVVASAGPGTQHVENIRESEDKPNYDLGPTGTAIRESRTYVSNDFHHDPKTVPWRHATRNAGIGSSISLPLFCKSVACGALVIYSASVGLFGEKEVALLETIAGDVSLGLDRIDDEQRRRNAEEALHEAHRSLELRVSERTAELLAANAELELFGYAVAHDLRGPLRSIRGFADLLLEEPELVRGSDALDYAMRISAGAGRMGEIIDDLLNLGRVARQDLDFAQVNLSKLVEGIATDFADRDTTHSPEIRIQPDVLAHGDLGLLRVLLENLLKNAWKYTTRTDQPVIEFGTTPTEFGIAQFVKDNGAGFDMSDASKMFEPFQRLHAEGDFKGTGIGLTIVASIVRRHNGRVWAEGAVGKGSTFFFTLGQA